MQLPQDCGNNANCFFILIVIGSLIGLGKALDGNQPFSFRVALGRALITGGLSVAAGGVLAFIPILPPMAVLGLGAMFASLGTSVLENYLTTITKVK